LESPSVADGLSRLPSRSPYGSGGDHPQM
jgi:hypothetical protein